MMREVGGVEKKLKKGAFEREITCWSDSALTPLPNKRDVAHKTPISDAQLACVQDFAVATQERGPVSVACWCQWIKNILTVTRTLFRKNQNEQPTNLT